ncbi:MAG: NPCBM/NEW2 domain-containing protein [Thermoguttaceae bacterium]
MTRQTALHVLVVLSCFLPMVRAAEPAQAGFELSMKWPTFVLDAGQFAGGAPPSSMSRGSTGDGTLEITFQSVSIGDSAKLETKLFVQLSEKESLFRKWAKVRLVGAKQPRLLKEVILDRIPIQGRPVWTHGAREADRQIIPSLQSQPVFMPGFFVGIEFPISAVRCEKDHIIVAHRPGVYLKPGEWYTTRTAVYGRTPKDNEVRTFQRYIASHRPAPHGVHIDYNSWWTAPAPFYKEKDILDLMKVFEQKLYKAHGVSFDTFCIDMGWSIPKSIWEIDTKSFPEKFSRLQSAAERMGSNLGLWISPSSCYPDALNGHWAKANGYETFAGPCDLQLCLGGPRYADRFKNRLTDLVAHCGVRQLKLDGYCPECRKTDHGHQPGAMSCEKIAEGMIAAMEASHQANPAVWCETTCFGLNPSPWWLFHVNSVVGTFGDDAPAGRVPAPVYRESYTTARDFFNLQGAALLPLPIGGQEVLGIIHQTPDPLMNDAVTVVLRGHEFLPVYVNPAYMNDTRWQSLAKLLRWTRKNEAILADTTPLLPAGWRHGGIPRCTDKGEMPRDPYGYAHVKNNAGLMMLRNPWIAQQSYRVKLDETVGFTPDGAKRLSAVSLYPEPRLYAENLKLGDTLDVKLMPYETIVLSLDDNQKTAGLPTAASATGSPLHVSDCKSQLQRVTFPKLEKALGPDWTCRLGDQPSALRLTCTAKVRVGSPRAELLVLLEGKGRCPMPVGRLTLNGRKVAMEELPSEAGWSATGLPHHEHWTFLRASLTAGDHAIALDQFVGDGCTNVSVWVTAMKPGAVSDDANALPPPESVSLGGLALMTPTDVAAVPSQAIAAERPVERIDGVFLDTLEPVSVEQGWGTLQKNRSVWEKPLNIGGRLFPRGLGTHAPSRIVYALDGRYRRFQSWVGADANNAPTVVFEVVVDGVKRWQSGRMTRAEQAAWIDVDVSGAKKIELIVHDAGNRAADHADWAEARLLR